MRFPAALWLFLLGGAAVAAAELCYLNAFFGVKFGRVSMLMSGHFKDRPDPQYLSTLEYLGSFLRPLSCDGKYFHTIPRIMLLLAAIYSGILLWRAPGRKKPLTLAVGCFFAVYLLHCYVVYKFFPFLHPERPNARYLLALIILGIALYTAAWELRSEHLKKYFREYTPLVQFLFNGILLVVMLIALINPLPKGENLLQLVNQNILLNNVGTTPVLLQLKLRHRQMTKADIKYAQMYMCTFAPLSELHPSNQRGWLDVSGKQDFYTDENGRIYRYLWGGKPAENTPLTAIVCYGSKCRRTQLVLKRAKKP